MRSIAKLMQNWQFTGPDGSTAAVVLPHTWNAKDGQDGGNDYWRGTCTYSTAFAAPAFDAASQQVWLQFEGVNSSAKVLLNGRTICARCMTACLICWVPKLTSALWKSRSLRLHRLPICADARWMIPLSFWTRHRTPHRSR